MQITRLYLRNYRVYEDELDLEMPPGLVGIYGSNGAGKSALLESVLFTLWGKSRTPKEGVRTSGVNAPCVTEVEFEHEGHMYVVRRTISGANHAVAAEAHADGLLAASGVTDTRKYLHSVLGMGDVAFRASVFAEQKQLAAFTNQAPAERRKLVLQLLGITPLDGARDKLRADAKAARDQHERLRSVLPDLPEREAAVEEAQGAAVHAEQERAAAEAEAADARRALDEAQATFDRLDADGREYAHLVAEGKAVRVELDRASERVQAVESELASLADAAGELDRLRPRAEGLAAAEARLRLLEVVAEAERRLVAHEVPDAPPAPDEEGCEAARTAADEAAGARAELDGRLSAAIAEGARARDALARSASLDTEAECPVCGQALGDAFEQVQAHRRAEVGDADDAVERLQAQRTDVAARAEQLAEVARQRRAELKAAQAARADWQRMHDRRAEAARVLSEARAALDPPPTDGETATLTAIVAEARQAARRCDQVEALLAGRPRLLAELEVQRARQRESTDARQTLLDKLEALAFDPDRLEAATTARTQAGTRLQAADAAAQGARIAHAHAAEQTTAATTRLDEARALHQRLDEAGDEARHLGRTAELMAAFRNAVVGTVGPRLSQQAADLFGELTDHEYDRLVVDPETYDIQVLDRGVPYKLERFSGSEADLANLALRVAISEHVRFQSGGAVGLLVLDEVFGPLDDDRKDRLIIALERLRSRFRQVLVVTHDTEVKEQLPHAIHVVKLAGRRATARIVVA